MQRVNTGKPLLQIAEQKIEFGTEWPLKLVNALLELRHAMDKITLLMDCCHEGAA